jgi:translocation and assembly module TamB
MRLLGILLAGLLLLFTAIVGGAWIALNTAPGRALAEREINHFAAPDLHISGLAGHFPADLKLASLSLADANGVYATAANLELRWSPLALFRRNIAIQSLTATRIDALRAPVAGKSSTSGSTTPPKLHLDINNLAIGTLHLAPALAGEDVTLALTGAAHLTGPSDGSLTLSARTQNGAASYNINGIITPANAALHLNVAEPPDGLLGHFAGPQIHAPLALDIALAGPRRAAALTFTAALGAARITGAGTLGLDPASPSADVTLSIPALAPFAAMGGKNIAGTTQLHLTVARNPANGAQIGLNGTVALSTAPFGLASLVGPAGQFSLLAETAGNTVNIQQLNLNGAQFSVSAAGSLAQAGIDLNTDVKLNQISALSPGIAGSLDASGTIFGTPKDFAVNALLSGDITERSIPSGPFSISFNAVHLPLAPSGTLTGSGALENSPLLLDAAFSRDAAGAAHVTINNALWKSLDAQAQLSLAPGALLSDGSATFKLGSLADFAAFSPIPLRGSLNGDFAHLGGQNFKLDLTARNLVVDPRLGAMNATLHALGPTNALSVQAQTSIASLFGAPARVALDGVFDLLSRSANLTTLTASWRQLSMRLLGPAAITTQPGIAIRHLNLAADGGRIGLNGTLTPSLNASLTLQNLQASLARMFLPSLDVTGTLSGTAHLTGRPTAPQGNITLDARAIKLHSGPAASLPPADFSGTADIAGKSAKVNLHLTAGPNLALGLIGLVPLQQTGRMDAQLTGRTDLRLSDPILAAQGSVLRGVVSANLHLTGSPAAPLADGTAGLTGGSVQNVTSGLSLTDMSADLQAAGQAVTLQDFKATAGKGSITGHGTLDLGDPSLPISLFLDAKGATPVSSDLVTETLDAALTLKGALRGATALGGTVTIDGANINIPKALPPTVADLPILNAGQPPPPPPAPPPPVALNILVRATNQIFVRGDGLFAELGGRLRITGTAANPNPEGGFELIRGNFSLASKTLQFTQGNVSFNGDGFMPTLDLEATTTSSNNTTATLTVGGTAARPTITLTSTPPLPSDEILAQLLFGESTANLTPFQAASLAAALAQLTGLGGGVNPLDKVRSALGLDELSFGGSGSGPPSVQAGRYVAPGVYVGASQATNGQGTQASVQINLYKGLKLQTTTGTSGAGSGNSSSVGLTYQFNY